MRTIVMAVIIGLLLPGALPAQEKKLTEEEAQQMIQEYRDRAAQAEAKIGDLNGQIETLNGKISELEASIEKIKTEIGELSEEWKRCQWGRYRVKEGDFLSKIAGLRIVYHDPSKWGTIYEANKDKVSNPDLIFPGWVLLIPGLDTYRVIPDDCLWRIASYLSVYSNSRDWPKIYEANKDKIRDADLIYPNQELTIPRE